MEKPHQQPQKPVKLDGVLHAVIKDLRSDDDPEFTEAQIAVQQAERKRAQAIERGAPPEELAVLNQTLLETQANLIGLSQGRARPEEEQ